MPDYPLLVKTFLSRTDVQINGDKSWDIQVRHPEFYKRVIMERTLGIGESYIDGWWTCDAVDELFCRLAAVQLKQKFDFPLHEKIKIAFSPSCIIPIPLSSPGITCHSVPYTNSRGIFLLRVESKYLPFKNFPS